MFTKQSGTEVTGHLLCSGWHSVSSQHDHMLSWIPYHFLVNKSNEVPQAVFYSRVSVYSCVSSLCISVKVNILYITSYCRLPSSGTLFSSNEKAQSVPILWAFPFECVFSLFLSCIHKLIYFSNNLLSVCHILKSATLPVSASEQKKKVLNS